MSPPLRICVLQSSYEGTAGELSSDIDPYRCPEIHNADGRYLWSHAYIKKATAVQQIRDLARSRQYDVFLNLCDGAFDEDRAGQEVVTALDRYGCAYTGADAAFYEPSKELMKKMAYYYDIRTAPWAFIFDIDMTDDALARQQLQESVQGLHYPLIVKHHNGYSSVGMDRDCKVTNEEQLLTQVRKFVDSYGGALVEEFVPGREFTVLVVENDQDPDSPVTLLPVECVFKQGEEFKHFELKWHEFESISWVPLDAAKEPELDEGLRHAAALAFVALKGCSYGRCDFRVDSQGRIFFLEINPNCGIFYPEGAYGSADVILSLDPQMNHARFTDHIIACALARRQRLEDAKKTEVRYRHGIGYGMYATRDLKQGEVVIRYEERPHTIVTQRHVAHVFGPECVPGPSPVDLPTTHTANDSTNSAPATQNNPSPARNHQTAEPTQAQRSEGDSSAGRTGAEGAAASGSGAGDGRLAGTQTHLSRLKGQWFKSYAYPISDEVWCTWSENPDDWLPLNHSCGPNTWLVGLDLVAMRDIKKGEHISADYATYSVHNMHEFACACGAERCRGTVRGTDYLEPWVDEQYGDHVSGYVASKRAMLKAQRPV